MRLDPDELTRQWHNDIQNGQRFGEPNLCQPYVNLDEYGYSGVGSITTSDTAEPKPVRFEETMREYFEESARRIK